MNYLVGSDSTRWRRDVPTYARVVQRQVWDGVDIAYYGRGDEVEYDVVVAPHVDPATVRLELAGARALSLEGDGSLRIETTVGPVHQHPPQAYQHVGGERREIDAAYALLGATEVGLRLGPYDTSLPPVFDPVVTYSTYLGGTDSDDSGYGIAVDRTGSVYVTGETQHGSDFPTVDAYDDRLGGYADAFVTKLTPEGDVAYSTYLGGGGWDGGHEIAVDDAGAAYVTGYTTSRNFPTANASDDRLGGSSDAFVTKLTPGGQLSTTSPPSTPSTPPTTNGRPDPRDRTVRRGQSPTHHRWCPMAS